MRRRKQHPATCAKCGAIVALRTSKNGVWQKFDLDDELDPTDSPHVCNEASSHREKNIPRGIIPAHL